MQPERVIEYLRRELDGSASVRLYWLTVHESRRSYASKLVALGGGLRFVTLRVDMAFTGVNTFASDLLALFMSHRDTICSIPRDESKPLAVVLLSRQPLSLPQVASPVALPEWFPSSGGCILTAPVCELEPLVVASLNCEEADVEAIRRELFQVDELLVKLLRQHVRACGAASSVEFVTTVDMPRIDRWASYLSRVPRAEDHRPSKEDSPVGCIADAWAKGDSRARDHIAVSVSQHIGAETLRGLKPPLLGIVPDRPGKQAPHGGVAVAVTIYSAVRWSHCCAHAAEYPQYPVVLFVSVARDIGRALQEVRDRLYTRVNV
jgi:hypothetical protein